MCIHTNTNCEHKAFTLIELLIVIAIISILASILFPVFARARENARRAGCMSNMKQIGIGVMMYTQDYDEHVPACYANNGGDSNHTFAYYIEPYTKNSQIYRCPSDSSTHASSYGYNYFYLAPHGLSEAVSIAAMQKPSETVMLVDSDYGRDYVYSPVNWKMNGGSLGGNDYGWVEPRHLETVSTLWADGHAKSQKVTALSGPSGCSGVACDILWDLD
jgi:prepilin-type N-terminal cleavage/methylation domain-containing protein